jgi:hypothetical protein
MSTILARRTQRGEEREGARGLTYALCPQLAGVHCVARGGRGLFGGDSAPRLLADFRD